MRYLCIQKTAIHIIDLSSIQPMVGPPHPGASVIAPCHRVLAGDGGCDVVCDLI